MKHKIFFGVLMLVFAAFLSQAATAQGVFFVKGGNTGISQANPAVPLHMTRSGDAQIFVEDLAGVGNKSMFVLKNPGKIAFELNNTTAGAQWTFTNNNSGLFTISKFGTGGAEVSVTGAGNMTIRGTLTENSSRTVKTDITPVDAVEVLQRLVDLPVLSWVYTHDNSGARHLGPMAEDFAVFGLGINDKTIAPSDKAGVALAAIQGLNAKVVSLEAERDHMAREFAELKATVAALVE